MLPIVSSGEQDNISVFPVRVLMHRWKSPKGLGGPGLHFGSPKTTVSIIELELREMDETYTEQE